ncbi:MAG: T9SS type A sorting domain-containing protein, partial [Calditrichaeota bacterium]|nr:T9SS type A sorting domain-containing protein [Calditrichota bacterium]
YYRLKDIDFNGNSAVHAIVSASLSGQTDESGSQPDHMQLSEAYPNPFGPGVGKTEVGFSVRVPENSAGKTTIGIWNLLGEEVRQFDWSGSHTGKHVFFWNGTGKNQQPVPAGVYFLRVKRENAQEIRKILFVR